jgi:NAD(P)-dependent dehydrogenase (short-subunit alcohol dehydrogenase family)
MLERFLATDPAVEARLRALEPVGRFAVPEEIAQTVMWICSNAASFVTGVVLPVDGGWTMQ